MSRISDIDGHRELLVGISFWFPRSAKGELEQMRAGQKRTQHQNLGRGCANAAFGLRLESGVDDRKRRLRLNRPEISHRRVGEPDDQRVVGRNRNPTP
jgi:hypothetical protein